MKGLPDARKTPGVYNPITTPPHSRRSMSYCVKSGHRQPRPTAHRPTPPDNPDPLCGVLVCFRSPSIHGHTVHPSHPIHPHTTTRQPPTHTIHHYTFCIQSIVYIHSIMQYLTSIGRPSSVHSSNTTLFQTFTPSIFRPFIR